MTEVEEGKVFGTAEAPAVASADPANLAGPGVTQNPDNAAQVFDLAQIAQQNAEMRAELLAENAKLKAALDEARAFGVSAQGLTDEDVRRIEHPEEYVEEYASLGEHEALKSQLSSLADRLDSAHRLIADAKAERAGLADRQAQPAPRETVAVTRDANDPDANAAADLSTLTDADLQAELDRRTAQA